MASDINNGEDIRILVDRFYEKAGRDALLAPIFRHTGGSAEVKETLYVYWNAMLLQGSSDRSHAFPPHIAQMFTRRHFIRWQELFLETIDSLYAGPGAEKAKISVIRQSETFQTQLATDIF